MHIDRAALAFCVALTASAAFAQQVTVTGPGKTITVSAAQLQAMPRVKTSAVIHDQRFEFEGVRLSDLLKDVGAPQGEALRGGALTDVVVVRSRDGYAIVLSLAETDPAMNNRPVVLADRVDGHAIDAADGPFRLVVDGELRPARSAKMVATIELRPLEPR